VESVDEYVQLVRGWKDALPDARGAIRKTIASGDVAAQEILWEGTSLPFAPLLGVAGGAGSP
jgi:hypothetical protein